METTGCCNKANWSKICDELKTKRADIIREYDDECFYIALARAGKAYDLIFWRCISDDTIAIASILGDLFPDENQIDEMCVATGLLDYTHLKEQIENNTIAHKMECYYDYLEFCVHELKVGDFPQFHAECFDDDSHNEDDSDDDDNLMFNTPYVHSCVLDNDRYMIDAINEILNLVRDHNKRCVRSHHHDSAELSR